jgi:hypothetical protein
LDFIYEEIYKGSLAGTNLSRDNGKPLVFSYSIFKMGVSVLVTSTHVEIARIGKELKRLLLQTIEGFIHDL